MHSENTKVRTKSNHTLLRTKFKSPINFPEPSHTAFNSSEHTNFYLIIENNNDIDPILLLTVIE